MKSVFYLGAAIALLHSTVALFSHDDHQDPMVIQNGRVTNKAADLANSTIESLEIQAVAQVADASIDDAVVLTTSELDDSSDANPYAHHPPTPKFQVGSTGSQWAITYIPYNDDLTCKSRALIHADVSTIASKGFTTLRLYATDCSALAHIATYALTLNLTLILGIHIDSPDPTQSQSQLSEIITWAASTSWTGVSMIVLGNEAIFNTYIPAPTLSTLLISSRSALRAAGYTGPVTTTEPIAILDENAALLCPAIDVAAANIHPFFHAEISADEAGAYVAEQLAVLEEICPGLEAVNLETGWPRRGRRNGNAVPGVGEQAVAMQGIMEGSGGRSVVLGFGDDGWKDEGEFGVEGSWGCGHLFGVD